jgi:hypothetical protein
MSTPTVQRVPEGTELTEVAPPIRIFVLIYALSGGVAWWMLHLVGLSAVNQAVCSGSPHWLLSLVNGVCLLGVISTLPPSVMAMRPHTQAGGVTGRSRFLGHIALLFNLASLALVVLESIPVYVLHNCS